MLWLLCTLAIAFGVQSELQLAVPVAAGACNPGYGLLAGLWAPGSCNEWFGTPQEPIAGKTQLSITKVSPYLEANQVCQCVLALKYDTLDNSNT